MPYPVVPGIIVSGAAGFSPLGSPEDTIPCFGNGFLLLPQIVFLWSKDTQSATSGQLSKQETEIFARFGCNFKMC